jgi:hypothetical protein
MIAIILYWLMNSQYMIYRDVLILLLLLSTLSKYLMVASGRMSVFILLARAEKQIKVSSA